MGLLAVLAILGLAAAMAWQQRRYVRLRRDIVQDRQPLLHPSTQLGDTQASVTVPILDLL